MDGGDGEAFRNNPDPNAAKQQFYRDNPQLLAFEGDQNNPGPAQWRSPADEVNDAIMNGSLGQSDGSSNSGSLAQNGTQPNPVGTDGSLRSSDGLMEQSGSSAADANSDTGAVGALPQLQENLPISADASSGGDVPFIGSAAGNMYISADPATPFELQQAIKLSPALNNSGLGRWSSFLAGLSDAFTVVQQINNTWQQTSGTSSRGSDQAKSSSSTKAAGAAEAKGTLIPDSKIRAEQACARAMTACEAISNISAFEDCVARANTSAVCRQ
jgi:hypothetical protein